MGEVWRATAIKILPAAFADDTDRLARFQREARVLASLNHPRRDPRRWASVSRARPDLFRPAALEGAQRHSALPDCRSRRTYRRMLGLRKTRPLLQLVS